MLERLWRKRNPPTLLVGIQIGTATMENSREIPLKIRNKTTIQPNNPILGIYPEETIIEKDTCTPMFSAALFTIARIWKQLKMSINRWMDKETVEHIYNGILLNHKKEHIWVSSNEVDEHRAYYIEWSKPESKKKTKYHTLMYIYAI